MTELEKIEHLRKKYATSKRLYTVYSRSQLEDRYTFTVIYGTDKKRKAQKYVQKKEKEGLFLIVYCANLQAQHSRCVFVSGLQNSLTGSHVPNTAARATPNSVALPTPAPTPAPPPLATVKG